MLRFAFILISLTFLAPPALCQIVRPAELRLQFHRAERAYRSSSSLHEAKSRLDVVISRLPDDAEALMLRAMVLRDLNRPEEALADARRAVVLLPGSGEAHLLRCEAALASGAADEAMAALKTAASLITGGAELHIRLSTNAQLLGDLDQAEAYARLAQTQDTTLPEAHRQLARVFVAKGRPEAAATVLAGAMDNGVLSPAQVRTDPDLSDLIRRPELARWFGN